MPETYSEITETATPKLMKRLLGTYLKPRIKALLFAAVFMILAAAATGAIAYMMETVLDDVVTGRDKSLIIPIAALLCGIFFVRGISSYIHTIMMAKLGHSIVADIQKDLFSKFMRLDLVFFHNNPSGELISRVINDVQVVRVAVADTLTGLGKNLFTLIALVIVMFLKDWRLSIAAFVIFPLIAMFVAYLGRLLRKVSKKTQVELSILSNRLSETFYGIRQVMAYGMEKFETNRARAAIDIVKKLNIKSARVSNLSTPVNDVLVGLILFGVIVYGGFEAAQGNMTAGELGSFITAFMLAYEPMKKLAKLNNTVQIGLGASERIFEMMDQEAKIVNAPDAKAITVTKPDIVFDNVSFAYEDSEAKALHEVSFVAKQGQVTALVGPSGSGKTTIVNLIPRFYDPDAGRILIQDQDIKACTFESVRQSIALVSQDITIFDDTIAANIAYGSIDIEQKDIEKAAKDAAAHDFIIELPEGYNTRVGQDGAKLSGGQRQRLAIARALLRDAPILLLDEATSALDNESEKKVQEALEVLEKGRTTIAIAHRLSTVRNADQILVLDRGEIKERGNHEELMAQGGIYKKMVETGLQE